MRARNLYDYLSVLPPNSTREDAHQFNSPCPFCNEGDAVDYNGHLFYGTDRLIWFKAGEYDRAFCRYCNMAGRGRNGHGIYDMQDFVAMFGEELEIDPNRPQFQIDYEPGEDSEERLPDLIAPDRRVVFASKVDTDFWRSLGFTDETIKHFHLGWGRLYTSWDRGHLIPMQVRTANREMLAGHYYETRIPNGLKFDKKNSAGSKKHIFWMLQEGQIDDGIVITESPKNILALWQMGYKNAIATFGAGVWTNLPDNFKFLQEAGYKRLYLVGDNDDAGQKFNTMLIEQALNFGLECYIIEWVGLFDSGYDVADLLKDRGTDSARTFMDRNFVPYQAEAESGKEREKPEFIGDYRATIDPGYMPHIVDPISIDEVRGEGERSLKYIIGDFLKTYSKRRVRGTGILLLLSARPGAGKSHALIKQAEQTAQTSYQRKLIEYDLLEKEITRLRSELVETEDEDSREILKIALKKLLNQHEEFTFQSVFWAAQYRDALTNLVATGANTSLYFDFQARSPENCENHAMATRLASQGHNLLRFCSESCPFAARCKERGYMAQFKQRSQYPIGVHRHEHLRTESVMEGYRDLVIVDESPLRVVEEPILTKPEECGPTSLSWENDMDSPEQVEAMQLFASGLQHTIRFNTAEPQTKDDKINPQHTISGSNFLRLLDVTLKHLSKDQWTLNTVMTLLTEKAVKHYQPNYVGTDLTEVYPIRLPHIYKVIERELPAYVLDPDNLNPSCLHLVSGVLETYPMERLHISSNTPVIVADATAMMPELYETAFKRDVEIYQPDIYNPNTEVVAIHGSDWTISSITRNIGHILDRQVSAITDVNGKSVSLEHLWNEELIVENRLVRAYLDSIMGFALKHKEGGLLIILHKRVRSLIEPIIRRKLPQHKLAFAHYGSVRGTNAWKDYEAVMLLGTPRVPYDIVWRRVQAWAAMRSINESVPFELAYVPTPYDGMNQGHTHINFTHPFAQRFVDQLENGEAVQAMERIRPHSSLQHKFVYLLSSRPLGMGVTRIEGKIKMLRSADPNSKLNAIAEYVFDQTLSTGTAPSKRDVMRTFRCNLNTATSGFTLAEERMNAAS